MNRREFAKCLLMGSTAPLGFLNQGVYANNDLATNNVTDTASRRLVLVELAGANDGLNTLVPYNNDYYHALRPTLGLHANELITINDTLAMHSSLKPLVNLWEAGQMAWVQGLGYPKPNRSHFKSIALWETAGDGLSTRDVSGWMTHAIEHQLARQVVDPHGITLAGDMDVFASESGRWLSLNSTEQISSAALPEQHSTPIKHGALAIVQQRLQTLDSTLSRLAAKVQHAPKLARFKTGAFGEQLRQVATLISAGVDTPVYRVRLDGFDTHNNQAGRHAQLLKNLSSGLNAFSQALIGMNEWQNTIIMTYSEFGRRAAENSAAGTDHGTAAPHLVLGGSIRGGLYSDAPDLADLPDGDPVHTMDYRALYERMLVGGLGTQTAPKNLESYADARLDRLFRT